MPVWKKQSPLTKQQKTELTKLFTEEHLSLRKIGSLYGKSASGIGKVLKQLGIDTSKAVGCWVEVPCSYCENPIHMVRAKFHRSRNHFCGQECYTGFLNANGVLEEHTHGRRKSRATVELFYGPLPIGSIVHHEDKNQWNSHPHNLVLLSCSKDHIRWHRGFRDLVVPLWVGSEVSLSDVQAKWYEKELKKNKLLRATRTDNIDYVGMDLCKQG